MDCWTVLIDVEAAPERASPMFGCCNTCLSAFSGLSHRKSSEERF